MARTKIHETRGRRTLCSICLSETQSVIAERLGTTQPSVSFWCSGKSRPDAHCRAIIREILGIPIDHWLTAPERRELAQARRRAAAALDGAAK